MKGQGRKKSKINEEVYPLLKAIMLKTAKIGGDTRRKAQCAKYRKIAYELNYMKEDISVDVRNNRMQRFDSILDFSLRAINQKKDNRKSTYEIDRLSRYVKDLMKRNIDHALE